MIRPSLFRLWEIDALRGAAVVLMAFFHLMWNLQYFNLSSIDVFSPGWQAFARSIGSSFMLLLGLSLALDAARRSLSARQLWVRNLRRAAGIATCALLVSLATYLAVNQDFVRFGILHLAAAAMVLGTFFVRLPAWVTAITGAYVLGANYVVADIPATSPFLIPFGKVPPGITMVDYYPIIPWFGMVLFGIALGKWLYPNGQRGFALPDLGNIRVVAGLRFLGRHSLAAYLLHQPILVGVVFTLSRLLP